MRRLTSLLAAGALCVAALAMVPTAAYAASPPSCGGTPANTCVPSNSTSDSTYPATGAVSGGNERPSPQLSTLVVVTMTLPDPGLPVCQHGFNNSIVNAPCYENQFTYQLWDHVNGVFETAQGYTEVNGTSHDATLDGRDYRLFLLHNTVQIYRADGGTVTQNYYGTYDRRAGAPAAAPQANFDYDIDSDGTVTFHATSTDFYDRPMTHVWDFGDGTTATGANPVHSYVDSGFHMVTLTTTNSVHLSDDYQRGVIATGHPLTISSLSLAPQSPVQLGDPLVAHVTVKNNGASTVTSITPTPTLTPTDKAAVGDGFHSTAFNLATGATKSFDVPIDTLAAGEAQLKVRAVGTVQGNSTAASASLAFDIATDSYAVTWSTDPSQPRPSEPFDLVAHVTNHHGSALHDVVSSLEVTPAAGTTVGDPDPTQIATLADGASADLTWSVTSTQGSLDAALDLSGKDTANQVVTGSAEHIVALHDIEVNLTGNQEIDPDALDGDRCDVNDVPDSDECTLRAAIQLANSRSRASAISFRVTGAATPRISPPGALPALTKTVTIDGRTQAGGLVELHGSGSGTGLDLGASGSTVAGLVVNGFDVGVRLGGDGHHRLLGNRIGTNVTGTAAAANRDGVFVDSHGDSIGGVTGTSPTSCSGDCNLISGNTHAQVINRQQSGAPTPVPSVPLDMTIQGNWLGVDASGRALAGGRAVDLSTDQATSLPDGTALTIGGRTSRAGVAPGNLIGAVDASGISVAIMAPAGGGQSAASVSIAGNSVGLAPTGATGNGSSGAYGIGISNDQVPSENVLIGGATSADANAVGGFTTGIDAANAETRHNLIGTDVTGTRAVANTLGLRQGSGGAVWDNVISGNGTGVSGAMVELASGNLVGLSADGSTALPNDVGVQVLETATIGTEGLTGPALSCAGPCNVVSGNRRAGILVDRQLSSSGVRVAGTYIGTDVAGTRAVPNGTGIVVRSPSAGGAIPMLAIGGASDARDGTCASPCNVVAGNSDGGLDYTARTAAGDDTIDNQVQGNVIGLGADGQAMPNGGAQLRFAGTGDGPVLVGGDRQHANRILSSKTGVSVSGTQVKAELRSNTFLSPSGADLVTSPGAPTRPVLRTATPDGSMVHVSGSTLATSDPFGQRDEVELYAGTSCDTGTFRPLVVTEAAVLGGDFTADVPASELAGSTHLLAVGTSVGRTSPFSACLPLGQHTRTAKATSTGTQEMEVASNAGFAPGDYVTVDPGEPHEETGHVAALGSLILEAPLRFSHAADAIVEKVQPPKGDRTAPTVSVGRPVSGGSYAQGSRVSPSVRCSDPGVGVATCSYPSRVETASRGAHVFTVQAVDLNGNARTVQVRYVVGPGIVVLPPGGRTILLHAVDPTPAAGHRARLVAAVPAAMPGRFRIVIKMPGAARALRVCGTARRCGVWTPRRSGQASYVAVLRSTSPRHRPLARSLTLTVRWH